MKIDLTDGSNDAHFNFVARYEFGPPQPGVERDDVMFEGTVKWDGCSHLYTGKNVEGQQDYMHLCNQFDEMIALLTALRDEGRRRWREQHPDLWK